MVRRSVAVLRSLVRHRRVLLSSIRLELSKRYSGSLFGLLWVFLQPALLLSIYLFVYLVVFKMKFPGYSSMDYVLFVFCGLIPYIGFSEALNTGCMSIKQNIHLVKNVILPIELIPIRAVAVSLPGQMVSMVVLLLMVIFHGSLSWWVLFLPLVLILQVMFIMGTVFVLSSLAVALPDVSYFVNLSLLLLIFISPIGFKPEMLPPRFQFTIYLNPVYYMIDVFRSSILADHQSSLGVVIIFLLMCLVVFVAGSAFFHKFKSVLIDYE